MFSEFGLIHLEILLHVKCILLVCVVFDVSIDLCAGKWMRGSG